jgi:hypothetical protein
MIQTIAAQAQAGNPVYSKRIKIQAAATTHNPTPASASAIPHNMAAFTILLVSY